MVAKANSSATRPGPDPSRNTLPDRNRQPPIWPSERKLEAGLWQIRNTIKVCLEASNAKLDPLWLSTLRGTNIIHFGRKSHLLEGDDVSLSSSTGGGVSGTRRNRAGKGSCRGRGLPVGARGQPTRAHRQVLPGSRVHATIPFFSLFLQHTKR